MDKIKASEVDWSLVGERIFGFRKMMNLTSQDFADKIGIPLARFMSYESGITRKGFGDILSICEKCRLSARWLLTGKGSPFKRASTVSGIDALQIDKGAGKRRPEIRKNAEDGVMSDDMLEFVMAIDEFKRKNKKPFVSSSEIYQLMLHLGYRKVENKSVHFNCVSESFLLR